MPLVHWLSYLCSRKFRLHVFISFFCLRFCFHYDLNPKLTIRGTRFIWRSINIHNKSKVRGLKYQSCSDKCVREHGGPCSLLTRCHIVQAPSIWCRIGVTHRHTVLHTDVAFSIVTLKMYSIDHYTFTAWCHWREPELSSCLTADRFMYPIFHVKYFSNQS
jgi:hypothetical protein